MKRLAETCGLRIEARKIVSVHGGSMLCILRHDHEQADRFNFMGGKPFEFSWPSPEPGIMSSEVTGYQAAADYQKFAARAQDVMTLARDRIKSEQGEGQPVDWPALPQRLLRSSKLPEFSPTITWTRRL